MIKTKSKLELCSGICKKQRAFEKTSCSIWDEALVQNIPLFQECSMGTKKVLFVRPTNQGHSSPTGSKKLGNESA